MAPMMLILRMHTAIINLIKFISINIIAAISWLPPLISQLFHLDILRLHIILSDLQHNCYVNVHVYYTLRSLLYFCLFRR